MRLHTNLPCSTGLPEIELEDLLQAGAADLKEAHGLWQEQAATQLCPCLVGAPNNRGADVAGEHAY